MTQQITNSKKTKKTRLISLFDVRVCIKARLWVGSPFSHRGPEDTQLRRTCALDAEYS